MRRLLALCVAVLVAALTAALHARPGAATSSTRFRTPDAGAACRVEGAALTCSSLGSAGSVAIRRHGTAVVASLGSAGVVAALAHGTWAAYPGAPVNGNPTGAGDALVAGLARGLARDRTALEHPEELLRDAVALATSTVRAPTAGDIDPAHYADELARVSIRALDGVG